MPNEGFPIIILGANQLIILAIAKKTHACISLCIRYKPKTSTSRKNFKHLISALLPSLFLACKTSSFYHQLTPNCALLSPLWCLWLQPLSWWKTKSNGTVLYWKQKRKKTFFWAPLGVKVGCLKLDSMDSAFSESKKLYAWEYTFLAQVYPHFKALKGLARYA